jgi:hypothetical protein
MVDYHTVIGAYSNASLNQPRVAAALARLTSLKRLELRRRMWTPIRHSAPDDSDLYAYWTLGSTCLQAIGSLSRLTKLVIEPTAPAADLTLLPKAAARAAAQRHVHQRPPQQR